MDAHEPVRRNVKRLLKRKRLSLSDLARGVGHSSSWASNFLGGKKGIPLDSVQKIATFLQVPITDLLAPPEKEPPRPRGIVGRVGLAKGLGETTYPADGILPPGSEIPPTEEVELMSRDTDIPDPLALLAFLPKDEQAEVLEDILRRAQRHIEERLIRGKATAV
jgi:transcriptional regulator with XRE-family HTH domain